MKKVLIFIFFICIILFLAILIINTNFKTSDNFIGKFFLYDGSKKTNTVLNYWQEFKKGRVGEQCDNEHPCKSKLICSDPLGLGGPTCKGLSGTKCSNDWDCYSNWCSKNICKGAIGDQCSPLGKKVGCDQKLVCDGQGSCMPEGAECSHNLDCKSTEYCFQQKCIPKKKINETCENDSDCSSSFCKTYTPQLMGSIKKLCSPWCEDSDGLNYLKKGVVSGTTIASGSATSNSFEDSCLISGGEINLNEGTCKNDLIKFVQVNCTEQFDDSYFCNPDKGACEQATKWNYDYLLENKGTLNCNKPANKAFCDVYNNNKKYFGLGTYSLDINDMVIIGPYIFKFDPLSFTGATDYGTYFRIIWVNSTGDPYVVGGIYLSSPFNPISVFKGGYAMLESADASKESISITFTDNFTQTYEWCKSKGVATLSSCDILIFDHLLDNELKYQKPNFVGFLPKEFDEFNKYLLNTYQSCYVAVKNFLQINPPTQPVYVTYDVGNGGGCSGNQSFINCHMSYDDIMSEPGSYSWKDPYMVYDCPMQPEFKGKKWCTFLDLADAGYCVDNFAQPHELTHTFTAGPSNDFLGEGLAEYVRSKVSVTSQKLKCYEDGFTLDGGVKYPYADLKGALTSEGYWTGACIWDYIETTYGHDKFVKIMQAGDKLSYKPGEYKIFADIINPILGEDILPILKDRFNLDEIIAKQEI